MGRIFLFVLLVIAFAAGIGYRLTHGTPELTAAPVIANEQSPAPSVPTESPAPVETVPLVEDDETDLVSVDEQKFESEDETEDTDDSLTIEVEEEE